MKKRGVFFYILILLALAAVAALVFLLAPGRQPATPDVHLPTPQPAESTAPTAPQSAEGSQIIAVSPETVQTALATLRRSDSYSRSLTIQDYWSGGGRVRTVQVWARGDNLRLAVTTAGDRAPAQENILIRGEEKWIWYADSARVYHGPALAGDEDAYQTSLTYEALLSADAEDILAADYRPYAELDCIFVQWRDGDYVSELFIDPETGLLMGERRYDGDILIYTMDSSVPDLTTPDENVFNAPKT